MLPNCPTSLSLAWKQGMYPEMTRFLQVFVRTVYFKRYWALKCSMPVYVNRLFACLHHQATKLNCWLEVRCVAMCDVVACCKSHITWCCNLIFIAILEIAMPRCGAQVGFIQPMAAKRPSNSRRVPSSLLVANKGAWWCNGQMLWWQKNLGC